MNQAKFTVSDDKKTLIVERAFDAPKSKVWAAWTTQELLEQWWAPKPWRAETKTFNFTEGGHWHYAMVGPKGEKHWGWMSYEKIEPEKMFFGKDLFCDETGAPNQELPSTDWKNEFEEKNGVTTVTIIAVYASAKDLDTVMEMGMEQGLSQALDQLEEIVSQ